jgi:hypothetical protein
VDLQSVHIASKVVSSNPAHGEVYSIEHYVIKVVSDLRPDTPVSPTNKTDRHDITEIVLKVALNTITLAKSCPFLIQDWCVCNKSNMRGVISETGTDYPSGGHVLDPGYYMY